MFVLFAMFCFINNVSGQDLSGLSVKDRNERLLKLSKEMILKYGDKKFYDSTVTPEIRRRVFEEGPNKGRIYYEITYPADNVDKKMNFIFLVKVLIYENTGKVFDITYGNLKGVLEKTLNKNEPENKIKKIKYESRKEGGTSFIRIERKDLKLIEVK